METELHTVDWKNPAPIGALEKFLKLCEKNFEHPKWRRVFSIKRIGSIPFKCLNGEYRNLLSDCPVWKLQRPFRLNVS